MREVTRARYPSDVTDAEWAIIEPLIPARKPVGKRERVTWPAREILDAVLYRMRTGCAWRHLPHDFPPWSTVSAVLRGWVYSGVFQRVVDALRRRERESAGESAEPTVAVIDTQSVKTTEQGGVKGFDAGKKVKGRKRHVLVDERGRLLAVRVHSAGIPDTAGGRMFFASLSKDAFPNLSVVYADGGYREPLVSELRDGWGIRLEIVPRIADRGFHPLRHRWVVERSFGWLNRERLLAKEYGRSCVFSEAIIQLAAARVSFRRLAHSLRPTRRNPSPPHSPTPSLQL